MTRDRNCTSSAHTPSLFAITKALRLSAIAAVTSCTRGSWLRAASSARFSISTLAASSSFSGAGSASVNGEAASTARNGDGAAPGEASRAIRAATRAASRTSAAVKPSA